MASTLKKRSDIRNITNMRHFRQDLRRSVIKNSWAAVPWTIHYFEIKNTHEKNRSFITNTQKVSGIIKTVNKPEERKKHFVNLMPTSYCQRHSQLNLHTNLETKLLLNDLLTQLFIYKEDPLSVTNGSINVPHYWTKDNSYSFTNFSLYIVLGFFHKKSGQKEEIVELLELLLKSFEATFLLILDCLVFYIF